MQIPGPRKGNPLQNPSLQAGELIQKPLFHTGEVCSALLLNVLAPRLNKKKTEATQAKALRAPRFPYAQSRASKRSSSHCRSKAGSKLRPPSAFGTSPVVVLEGPTSRHRGPSTEGFSLAGRLRAPKGVPCSNPDPRCPARPTLKHGEPSTSHCACTPAERCPGLNPWAALSRVRSEHHPQTHPQPTAARSPKDSISEGEQRSQSADLATTGFQPRDSQSKSLVRFGPTGNEHNFFTGHVSRKKTLGARHKAARAGPAIVASFSQAGRSSVSCGCKAWCRGIPGKGRRLRHKANVPFSPLSCNSFTS